jgi:tRNA (uracil-5-)-methyltransferase
MMIFQVHPQQLTELELSQLKIYIMTSLDEFRSSITTLLLQQYTGRTVDFPDIACETLWGDGYVHERLFGLQFRISPTSFFQTNTTATEILYSVIKNEALLGSKENSSSTPSSILLDLCSGTGTIGISLSSFFKEVIGIESNRQAVLDAEQNARLNQLNHVRFICGKVEEVLETILHERAGQSIVAVLDPPRQGIRK